MSRLFYFVQPANEPHGEGNGYDDATDADATVFFVKGQNLSSVFDYTLDAIDESRPGAQAIADAWNRTHGICEDEDGPTEDESCEIKRVIRTRAVPAGIATAYADETLALALEEAFPNEAAEVGEEDENNA